MSRGLTAEKARERRERGLCPRHDVPAQPGGVLCARCLGKVDYARLYRVSSETLAAMARAVGAAALALWLVACPVGAASPPVRDLRVAAQAPQATAAVTLSWTMPTRTVRGDTLWTAPLDWEVAYSTQSATWVAHAWDMRTNPDTFTVYWPTVVAEGSPLVVASGVAIPGAHVAWPALPVQSYYWPFSWWIRTRQRPNGAWSRWSNPCSRADNN